MANVHIGDDILYNILARLPAKSLLRSKCVSTHWNRLISDPRFMKSLSRRKILLVDRPTRGFFDVDDDLPHSMFKRHYPFEKDTSGYARVVGTFNGIVLLVVNDYNLAGKAQFTTHMILYNPFTGTSKMLHDPYSPFDDATHVYGFGYGATQDDLKIVRFRGNNYTDTNCNTCDVFNLKTSSWSISEIIIQNTYFKDDVGTFLNGFLYWISDNEIVTCIDNRIVVVKDKKIVALSVKDMRVLEIPPPYPYSFAQTHLDTLNGYLCMITNTNTLVVFDVWMLKKQGVENSWSKVCWFTSESVIKCLPTLRVIEVMNDGRILLVDIQDRLIIYDISKHSYAVLTSQNPFNSEMLHGIEYEESLISPSDICYV